MAGPTKKVGRRVHEKPTTTKGKFIDTKGKYGKKGKTYRTYSELEKKPYKKKIKGNLTALQMDRTRGIHPSRTQKFYAEVEKDLQKYKKKKTQHKNPRKRKNT